MIILELVAKERDKQGLTTTEHPTMLKLAEKQAKRMARVGRLSHNYSHPYMEVVCYCSTPAPKEAFEVWMDSRPHRRILLASWKWCGFAVAEGHGRHWWCGVFSVRGPK